MLSPVLVRRLNDLWPDSLHVVTEAVEAFTLVALDSVVLERASEPSPTTLGSLDAIHLASALLVRDNLGDLAFATHDDELGMAAQATGFQVHGVSRGIQR